MRRKNKYSSFFRPHAIAYNLWESIEKDRRPLLGGNGLLTLTESTPGSYMDSVYRDQLAKYGKELKREDGRRTVIILKYVLRARS